MLNGHNQSKSMGDNQQIDMRQIPINNFIQQQFQQQPYNFMNFSGFQSQQPLQQT